MQCDGDIQGDGSVIKVKKQHLRKKSQIHQKTYNNKQKQQHMPHSNILLHLYIVIIFSP